MAQLNLAKKAFDAVEAELRLRIEGYKSKSWDALSPPERQAWEYSIDEILYIDRRRG